jgi:Domain of unknown function (DUF4214)/RTX calcium-binding nonapeptide repeat (4 copies)
MANVFSNIPFDYKTLDINVLVRYGIGSTFQDNINISFNGFNYEDVALFQYRNPGHVNAYFGGHSVTLDAAGYATSGVVTGFFETIWDGTSWVPGWGIQNISYPVVSLSQAALTLDTRDDFRVISDMLASDDLIVLSQFNDQMRGFLGNDRILGNSGHDVIYGDEGNDRLVGGSGNDYLDGGLGLDVIEYSGSYNEYRINLERGTIEDSFLNRDGADRLVNVERLQFADTNVALDVGLYENAGMAYRIYRAAFDRAPDALGLANFIAALDQGVSPQAIATEFTRSAEFQTLYGLNVSNDAFVELLYQNALDRPSDQVGKANWVAALESGAQTRADLLIGFSESAENYQATIELIGHGLEYPIL